MKKVLLIVAAIALFIPLTANAVGLYVGDQVSVPAGQTADVYAIGGTVQITDRVDADVRVAAGMVTIDGDVAGDIVVAGGQVTINGNVGGDILVFAGHATINGTVGDDVAGAAGQITIARKSHVAGDLVVASGYLDLSSPVDGSAHIVAGEVHLSNEIKGDLKVLYDEQLVFAPQAHVGGNLFYTAKKEREIPAGLIAGTVTYNTPEPHEVAAEQAFLAGWVGLIVFGMLSMLLTALVLLWLIRPGIVYIGKQSLQNTWKRRLMWGLLVLCGGPIVAMLLFITVIGVPLGFIILALWGVLLYLSCVISSLIVGSMIMPVRNDATRGSLLLTFLIGGIVLAVLSLIPILGWIIKFLVVLLALGAIVEYRTALMKKLKANGIL